MSKATALFTLYHEQVGALSLKLRNEKVKDASEIALRAIIRKNYSAPSQFGASIVANILNSPDLYRIWCQDLREIRELLAQRRKALLTRLTHYSIRPNYVATGLFLRLNLSKETIAELRNEDAVYLLDCGRISLAACAGANRTPIPLLSGRTFRFNPDADSVLIRTILV
jgi:aromatic-amino-acid transaminase